MDSSQGLAASYRYDPFGNTLASSGTLAATNVYRFSSKECHANSGMYYYLYRFYDPSPQRWITRDPLGKRGGVTYYTHLANDPVNALDPEGLFCWTLRLCNLIGLFTVNTNSPACCGGTLYSTRCTYRCFTVIQIGRCDPGPSLELRYESCNYPTLCLPVTIDIAWHIWD